MIPQVLQTAFEIAFEAHKGEVRKSPKAIRNTIPYIIHPGDVVKRMVNWGVYCPITLAAGELHDVEESRPGEGFLLKFEKLCPADAHPTVKSIIRAVEEELTYIPKKQWKDDYPKKKWESKEDYLSSFMTASIPALAVKVSDRICNVWDFIHIGNENAKTYFEAAECLFNAMTLRKDDLVKHYTIRPVEAMFMDYEYLRAGIMG